MSLSVQQALLHPNGAPEIPKATFDAATLDLKPLHLVTKLSHLQEDQARLETQLQSQKGPGEASQGSTSEPQGLEAASWAHMHQKLRDFFRGTQVASG